MEIRISKESEPSERSRILEIYRQAFGAQQGEEIAQLVDDLFNDETARPIRSLVASEGETLLGHILFTKVTISGQEGLLAPYLIPQEHADAWMVQDLTGGLLGKVSGTVHCSKALSEPQHWRE